MCLFHLQPENLQWLTNGPELQGKRDREAQGNGIWWTVLERQPGRFVPWLLTLTKELNFPSWHWAWRYLSSSPLLLLFFFHVLLANVLLFFIHSPAFGILMEMWHQCPIAPHTPDLPTLQSMWSPQNIKSDLHTSHNTGKHNVLTLETHKQQHTCWMPTWRMEKISKCLGLKADPNLLWQRWSVFCGPGSDLLRFLLQSSFTSATVWIDVSFTALTDEGRITA